MSFLWLSDADVDRLLTMRDALTAVESAFHELGNGHADNCRRSRARGPTGLLSITGPAVLPKIGRMGFKAFSVGLPPFHSVTRAPAVFALYDSDGGALLALMEAESLGYIRTGAASGVATDHMSRSDSRVVGMFGAGRLAMAQLQAVALVREITEIRVHNRNPDRRKQFCVEVTANLGIKTIPVAHAREVVEGCDIVITATTASEPLFDAAWVGAGTHINAVGANFADRRELSAEVIARCRIVAVDALDQAQVECGDLIAADDEGLWNWDDAIELGAIVTKKMPGRRDAEDITLFESQGLAIEDVAGASQVYRAFIDGRALGSEVTT
jgi:ornithine cyclodeaminase/alanine dehydrogenase-like protein (mu-crystallin family)